MGPKKDVIDIVTELGGIRTAEAADKLLEQRVSADQLAKLNRIQNEAVRQKFEALQKKMGKNTDFASREKVIAKLEKWLEQVAAKKEG